jgi:hypothetical protein
MKIAFTSDVHAGVTRRNEQLLPFLAREVDALAPDLFILAGDTANNLSALDLALGAFDRLSTRKLLIPGNHDLWIESKRALRRGEDSWHKYVNTIGKVCLQHGFHYLVGAPLVISGVGFVGSVGWYDYSLRDPRLDNVYRPIDYERGHFADASGVVGFWNDVTNAVWLNSPDAADWRLRTRRLSNIDVFSRVCELLSKDLQQVSEARTVVAVLHTCPFVEGLIRKPVPDPFDAYEGSTALGDLLAGIAEHRPVVAICGHRHQPLDVVVRGVRLLRSPVGYLKPSGEPMEEVAASTIGVVEV